MPPVVAALASNSAEHVLVGMLVVAIGFLWRAHIELGKQVCSLVEKSVEHSIRTTASNERIALAVEAVLRIVPR